MFDDYYLLITICNTLRKIWSALPKILGGHTVYMRNMIHWTKREIGKTKVTKEQQDVGY